MPQPPTTPIVFTMSLHKTTTDHWANPPSHEVRLSSITADLSLTTIDLEPFAHVSGQPRLFKVTIEPL